jgi:exosortase
MTSNTRKKALFLLAASAAFAVVFESLNSIVRTGRPNDYYSHIPLIPVISAYVFYARRKKMFGAGPGSLPLGIMILILGLGLFFLDRLFHPGLIDHTELRASSAILLLSGSYITIFGWRAFREWPFPFGFLLFAVPLPMMWMERIVLALVSGSTGVTFLLFKLFGVPFAQQGSIFHLPAFNVEIARECSGIRSSLALVITSILAGQIFLRKPWKRIVLVLAVIPVTILKNGLRIVILYLLSYFVDMRIIEGGFLHKSGGFLFFGLSLCIIGCLLWLLREPDHPYALGKRELSRRVS